MDGAAMLSGAGSTFGIVALLALVLAGSAGKRMSLRVAFAAVPVALGYALGALWLKDAGAGAAFAMGGLVAVVFHLLIPAEGESGSGSIGLALVLTVALATVSFALSRGVGIALSFVGAFTVLACVGNLRAVTALGPLVGIALFRDFRTVHPEMARAFDIGQHYAIVGLLMGMVVPLVLVDWSGRVLTVTRSAALVVWAGVLLGLAPVLALFFGAFGVAGFIIGTGLAGAVEVFRGGSSAKSVAAGAGLAGVSIVSYAWLRDALNMARDQKVQILIWTTVALVIAAALIWLLSRGPVGRVVHETE
jgi:hypothetical protein